MKYHMFRMILIILVFRLIILPVKAFKNGIEIESDEFQDHNFLFAILKREANQENKEWKYSYLCTATAISKRTLITAAHCFNDYWNKDLAKEWQKFYIHPAKLHMNLENLEGIEEIDINDVKRHPKFISKPKITCPTHDTVTIPIQNTILIEGYVSKCEDIYTNGKAISLIKKGTNNSDPYVMNYGEFQVAEDPNICAHENKTFLRDNETQICTTPINITRTEGIIHSENGDSGAPLIVTRTLNSIPRTCLMGVLSCGAKRYTIFSQPTSDIWKELSPESHNATATNESTKKILDTTLYYDIMIIIGFIVSVFYYFYFCSHKKKI